MMPADELSAAMGRAIEVLDTSSDPRAVVRAAVELAELSDEAHVRLWDLEVAAVELAVWVDVARRQLGEGDR